MSALFKVKALKTKMQSCYTNTHTTADCGDGMNGKAAKCKCVSVCECVSPVCTCKPVSAVYGQQSNTYITHKRCHHETQQQKRDVFITA